jgi:murein DD-endopeptidase MepM/ murein hydrolase activator NlpD
VDNIIAFEVERPDSTPPTLGVCARCGETVDVRSRHLTIDGSVVRAFCSEACVNALEEDAAPARTRSGFARQLVRIGVGLPMLVFTSGTTPPTAPEPPKPPMWAIVEQAAAAPEAPRFGPAWPPSEKDWLQAIASDTWLHPLDGPIRRMPVRDSRVFGAERPGDRPAECRSGHCGVDIGGEVWGEPVHAAHDGVIDRVQRGPNEDHGGLYVRLAHRDGSIFTQYFHLAAIPRRLEPGVHVKVGEVIGLLGDTGVKRSTAHLHFTVSVKPSSQELEQYIDPEPLIALWPLRLPVETTPGGAAMLTASAAPGVPRGAAGHTRTRRVARAALGENALSE